MLHYENNNTFVSMIHSIIMLQPNFASFHSPHRVAIPSFFFSLLFFKRNHMHMQASPSLHTLALATGARLFSFHRAFWSYPQRSVYPVV